MLRACATVTVVTCCLCRQLLSRVADLLVARPPRASVGQARDGQARQEQAGAASSNVRT
jgi:hypothetical protein